MALLDASDAGALSELEAAIRDFVADESRDSMQLPRLTTGQRRRARAAIAEAHPELRCENTGTGAERRLVLLKAGAAALAAAPAAEAPEDLGAAIAAFLADATRESWELPPLGAERRREAKRLAEAHPELRCESFGFGAERRLHLFKRHDIAAAPDTLCLPLPPRGDEGCADGRHSDESTCASPSSAVGGAPKLQVRNTFLCTVDVEAADPRAVQSMPAGLFGHLLLEELMQSKLSAPRAPAPGPLEPGLLEPGAEVEIHGLTLCPAFNGCRGSVQQLDAASGRYDVLLEGPGQRWAKIRAENLRPLAPCPPPSFPPSMGSGVAAR